MNKTHRIVTAVSVVAIVGGAATAALASGAPATDGGGEANEVDVPITGDALTRASDAALAHLGGGRVTETEVGDEESMYEVEVTRDDGTQVDVQLDEQFNVVGTEDEGPETDGDDVQHEGEDADGADHRD